MEKGTKIHVENCKVYPTHDSKINSIIINGDYYIYNETERNNRIRVTDDINKINIPCSMTGWININDIKIINE